MDIPILINNPMLYRPLLVFLDDEDVIRVKKYTWSLTGKGNDIITSSAAKRNEGTGTLGRYILKYLGPLTVDHKDRNILNNYKNNLRICTSSQQQANKGPIEGKKYKGVSFHKRDKIFQAIIEKDRRSYYGGYFKIEEDAARAYDKLAQELFGEFAYLNFP